MWKIAIPMKLWPVLKTAWAKWGAGKQNFLGDDSQWPSAGYQSAPSPLKMIPLLFISGGNMDSNVHNLFRGAYVNRGKVTSWHLLVSPLAVLSIIKQVHHNIKKRLLGLFLSWSSRSARVLTVNKKSKTKFKVSCWPNSLLSKWINSQLKGTLGGI
jgi:hypothetical protein